MRLFIFILFVSINLSFSNNQISETNVGALMDRIETLKSENERLRSLLDLDPMSIPMVCKEAFKDSVSIKVNHCVEYAKSAQAVIDCAIFKNEHRKVTCIATLSNK